MRSISDVYSTPDTASCRADEDTDASSTAVHQNVVGRIFSHGLCAKTNPLGGGYKGLYCIPFDPRYPALQSFTYRPSLTLPCAKAPVFVSKLLHHSHFLMLCAALISSPERSLHLGRLPFMCELDADACAVPVSLSTSPLTSLLSRTRPDRTTFITSPRPHPFVLG